jgi:hypothetical protein
MRLKEGKGTKAASELCDGGPLWRYVNSVRVFHGGWNDFLIIIIDGELKRVVGLGRQSRRKVSMFEWKRVEVLGLVYFGCKYVLVRRRNMKSAIKQTRIDRLKRISKV